jgi:hypothetical protein
MTLLITMFSSLNENRMIENKIFVHEKKAELFFSINVQNERHHLVLNKSIKF